MDRRFLGSKNKSSKHGKKDSSDDGKRDSSEDDQDGRKRGPRKRNRRNGRGPGEDPRCSIMYDFYDDEYIEKIGIKFTDYGDRYVLVHVPCFVMNLAWYS